jgi:hypothetical protein
MSEALVKVEGQESKAERMTMTVQTFDSFFVIT